MKRILIVFTLTFTILVAIPLQGFNCFAQSEQSNLYEQRLNLYKDMEFLFQIPWYYIAAIDQYERNVTKNKENKKEVIAIFFSKEQWAGKLNPNPDDENPGSIALFNGFGIDGNGDGIANRNDDFDTLVAFLTYLSRYGTRKEDILTALSDYYHREMTVQIIKETAVLYKSFGYINLSERVFPIPKWRNYSYRSTWGDARGWGGRRIHEGTDIFASYGTPVRSVSYGYIEILGWNKYGGWRIGIRGDNNIYYYYAHLTGFQKGLKEGHVVKPGDVIGYVGSSGYGPKGTQGKFPPHLHFGMYKYNGRYEWAFDPTPYLRIWERKRK